MEPIQLFVYVGVVVGEGNRAGQCNLLLVIDWLRHTAGIVRLSKAELLWCSIYGEIYRTAY